MSPGQGTAWPPAPRQRPRRGCPAATEPVPACRGPPADGGLCGHRQRGAVPARGLGPASGVPAHPGVRRLRKHAPKAAPAPEAAGAISEPLAALCPRRRPLGLGCQVPAARGPAFAPRGRRSRRRVPAEGAGGAAAGRLRARPGRAGRLRAAPAPVLPPRGPPLPSRLAARLLKDLGGFPGQRDRPLEVCVGQS